MGREISNQVLTTITIPFWWSSLWILFYVDSCTEYIISLLPALLMKFASKVLSECVFALANFLSLKCRMVAPSLSLVCTRLRSLSLSLFCLSVFYFFQKLLLGLEKPNIFQSCLSFSFCIK